MNDKKEKKNVGNVGVEYCRVSTDEQKTSGLSLDVQEKLCKEKLIGDGYKVLEVIRDEGKSGGSMKRAGIQRVLTLAKEKKINAVCAVDSSRMSRNSIDYAIMSKQLAKNGVRLIYVNQQSPDNTAVSNMVESVITSMNQFYIDTTSEKVKATLYAKARAGYFPSTPPPGYKNIDNPNKSVERIAGKIVIQDDETAPLIKEMFKLYSMGDFNVYDLQDIMYEKGLRSRRGGKLSRSRLYDLLKNRFYLGEVKWGEVNNKNGKHKPLIEEYIFDKVQSVMASNNKHACRRRKYTWLLNGFLYCYKHEKRYTAEWHLNKKIAYYHCTNRSGCGKYSEQVQMETKVADKFKDIEFSKEFVDKIIEKAKEVFYKRREFYDGKRQGLVNQKTALEAKKRIMEDKLFDGVISDEDFTHRTTEIKKDIKNIEDSLLNLNRNQEIKVDIAQEILLFTRNIYKAYKKASPNLKRHYLGFFWQKFEVSEGIIIKSHLTPLFEEILRLEQVSLNTPKPQINNVSNEVIIINPWLRRQDSNL